MKMMKVDKCKYCETLIRQSKKSDKVDICFSCKKLTSRIGNKFYQRGYYCGSAGHVSQEQVKRYIQEQEGKPVFEYDVFNCPKELKGQMKIGDFSC